MSTVSGFISFVFHTVIFYQVFLSNEKKIAHIGIVLFIPILYELLKRYQLDV